MNWVDIKYTKDSIKKDAENGYIIPKFSNNLSNDFDFQQEVTFKNGVAQQRIVLDHNLNGTCYAVLCRTATSRHWEIGIVDQENDYISVGVSTQIRVRVSKNSGDAWFNGTPNRDIDVEILIRKIF